MALALVVGALAPTGASAEFFTSSSGAAITMDQVGNHKITITGQEVFCEDVTFSGTAPSSSFEELALAATYKECKFKVFGSTISATVTGFGKVGEKGKCWYLINAQGTMGLACNEGEITIDAGTCVVHIGAQYLPFAVHYQNGTSGGVGDVTAFIDFEKLFSSHTDGFLCPLSGGGSSMATIEGTSTMTASAGGSPVTLKIDTDFEW